MRFLLRVVPEQPDRHALLASLKGLARSLGARVTHPRWTSYGALEVDVFLPSVRDFELLTAVLEPLAKEWLRMAGQKLSVKTKVVRREAELFD